MDESDQSTNNKGTHRPADMTSLGREPDYLHQVGIIGISSFFVQLRIREISHEKPLRNFEEESHR
jgi:hypothetical protein